MVERVEGTVDVGQAADMAAGTAPVLVAQADAPAPQAPAPEASGDGQRLVLAVDEGSVVRLPAEASIDQPRVNGTDLEFVQADGSVIVVPNGAIQGLTIMIGAVEIPPQTVAALFAANDIQAAAGPATGGDVPGSGGNFEVPVGGIGDALPIGTLLDPTALAFGRNVERPFYDGLDDGLGASRPRAGLNGLALLDDDDLAGGNPGGLGDDASGPLTGTLAHDYGRDGGASLLLTGAALPPGLGFTSAVSANGLVLTISQDGVDVLRITLSDTTGGNYTIEQLGTIRHPGVGEDNVNFDITYRVTDTNGNFVDGNMSINVDDDTPEVAVGVLPEGGETGSSGVQLVLDESFGSNAGDGNSATDDVNGAAFSGANLTTDIAEVASKAFGQTATAVGEGGSALAAMFTSSVSLGADGGTVAHQFSLSLSGGGTGGVATNLMVTAVTGTVLADPLTDRSVHLFAEADGSITGRIGGADGLIAIRISLANAGDPASVSLIVQQLIPLAHGDILSMDEAQLLQLIGGGESGGPVLAVNYTVTATDGDGDVAGQTASITLANANGGTISFEDDGPVLAADTDSLAAGVFSPATGNVLTGIDITVDGDTNATDGSADNLGADGGTVVGVARGITNTTLVDADTVGLTVMGYHGQLTILADGSYTYIRNPASKGGYDDVFTYTVRDGDGDLAQTTLTIKIGDSAPEISNLTPASSNGDVTVYESALNAGTPGGPGSTPASPSETASGTFTVTSIDGIMTLTVGGLTVISDGVFTAGSITTPLGNTLAVTGYDPATGVVTYSYTLTDNQAHSSGAGTNSLFENLTVVLTDLDNDSTSGTLAVNIVDDVPVLAADIDNLAAGVYTPATGNVLTGIDIAVDGDANATDGSADNLGADGGVVVGVAQGDTGSALTAAESVGAVINGLYGQLTLNADGSYAYIRNANSAGGRSDVFTYTVRDGDGDLAHTTLTINIANSTPTITNLTPSATGGDVTVYEDDLLGTRGAGESAGSDTTKESTTATGDFTITSGDGIKTLTVGGLTVITNGVFTAGSITTPLGNTLTVSAYDAATGVVSYSYTLNDNQTHADGAGNNSLFEDLAVELTDHDDQSASGTLSVNIVDDVPVLVADTDTLAAGVFTPATGNVLTGTETAGDTNTTDGAADNLGADGGTVVGVAKGDTGVALVSADSVGDVIIGYHGQLTLLADGSYSYVRNPNSAGGASDVFTYTVRDSDGDLAYTTLTINIENSTPTLGNLTPSADGGDVTVYEDDLLGTRGTGESAGSDASKESTTATGSFTVTSVDGVKVLSIGNLQVITDGVFTAGSITTPLGNTLTVSAYDAATGVVTYSYTLNDNQTHANGSGNNSLFEDLYIELLDYDQEGAYGTLSVNIVDDVPVLAADTDSLAVGVFTPVTGNVLTGIDITVGGDANTTDGSADNLGADGGTVVGVARGITNVTLVDADTVGLTVMGYHGRLTIFADGSYTYIRNPGTKGGVDDPFTYTVRDGDGDLAQTTLTIKIGDSAPEISNLTPATSNGDVTVYENALNAGTPGGPGSTPASTSETASGTFTVTSIDGIKTLTVGGLTVISDGVFTAGSITTPLGNTLAVTDYDPTTGVVTYSYTLTDNQAHSSGAGTNSLFENLTVVLTDMDNDTTSGTLAINIVDDVPAVDFSGTTSVNENAMGTVGGSYLFRPGADGTLAGSIAIAIGGSVIATVSATDLAAGATIETPAGQLVLSAPTASGAGTWTFDPGPVSATTTIDVTISLTDNDGDSATDTHSIKVNNITAPLSISGAVTGIVEEEHGLPGGNEDLTAGPDIDADTAGNLDATTNVASGDYADLVTGGVDGTLAYAFKTLVGNPAVQTVANGPLTSGGQPVLFAIDAAGNLVGYVNSGAAGYQAGIDTKVFTMTLDPETGAYTFTLNAPVDHPINTVATEDSIAINLNGYVTVTDVGDSTPGNTAQPLNGTITIIDDIPIASNDTATLNIVVDDLNVASVVAQWQILSGGSNIVYTDSDGDGAGDLVQWGSGGQSGYGFVDSAPAVLNGLQTNETFSLGQFTHFNQSINSGTSISSAQLTVNFAVLINGELVQVGPIVIKFDHNETPNGGTAEQDRDIITITTTTATVNIEGQNYTLDVRGFVDEQNNIVSTVRTYEGQSNSYQLAVRFVSSDSTSVTQTGNVIGGSDASGADLPLQVAAIAYGLNKDTSADGSGNFQVNGAYGALVINKDGTYTYTLTKDASSIPANAAETFTYTVKDADGDPATATLTINLNKVDSAANPLHGDRVLTNIAGSGADIVISQAALLYNDDAGSSMNGNVSGITDATSVVNGGGNFTFKDNDSDGGKFTYHGQNGALTDNAVVTVDRSQANSATLNGTAFGEILIGREAADTINGGGGDDYIIANGGADTIDGGAGIDVILAGAGDDIIIADQADKLIDGGEGQDTLRVAGAFTSASDAQIVNVERITLTGATTLNLSNQTEGFTITGSSAADSITGGSGNDTIIAAQNDTLINGGGGTDTLQIGSAFTSTGDGQITNVENIVLTSTSALNLTNQTDGFAITANSAGNTITASTGADRITINADASDTDWTINLGNDTAADKIIFNHASVGTGHDTVATVTNFNVAHDRISISVGGTSAVSGGFQTITTANTNVTVGVGGIVELVSTAWDTTSLSNDGNNGTIEGFIQSATNNFTGGTGTYTFIVYSTNTSSAHAGIYSVTISDSTNPNQGGMVVEHIMTLNGVGYGSLSASNFAEAADPIVLDLNSNGYDFSPLAAGVIFDLDGDNTKDQVAWNSSNDGMLAYDANGNGVVDNGTELFTPWFNGGDFANGSAALASLDDNGDGVIDAQDEAFAKLSIWQDANSDGVTDAGELRSLGDHGITSLSAGTNAASGEIDGQAIVGEGSFTRADGSTGGYVEVELETAFGAGEGQTLVADDYGDILTGGHGDDILIAGLGTDTLSGGAGKDTFVLGQGEGADTIADFLIGDIIDLSDLLPGAVGNEGDVQFKYADGSTKAINTAGGGVDGDVTIQVHDTSGWHDVAVIKDTGHNLSGAAESINLILDDNQTVKIFDI